MTILIDHPLPSGGSKGTGRPACRLGHLCVHLLSIPLPCPGSVFFCLSTSSPFAASGPSSCSPSPRCFRCSLQPAQLLLVQISTLPSIATPSLLPSLPEASHNPTSPAVLSEDSVVNPCAHFLLWIFLFWLTMLLETQGGFSWTEWSLYISECAG